MSNYDKPYMILSTGEAAALQLALSEVIRIAEKHTPKGGDRIKIKICKKALLVFNDPKFVSRDGNGS